jgi:hypothetical protein
MLNILWGYMGLPVANGIWNRLDERNEGNRLALEVGECVGSGERLVDIAMRLGCEKVGELRGWLMADEGREFAYQAGLKACVEGMVVDGLERVREMVEIADGVDEGNVDMVKVRMEGRDKYVKNAVLLAERVDPGRWGRGQDSGMKVAENLSAVLRAISEKRLAERKEKVIVGQ